MKIIEKLQNKPRHIRVVIMWLAVSVSMAFLIFIWVWSFDAETKKEVVQKNIIQDQPTSEFKNQVNQIPTLWQSLKAGIGNLFESEYIQENRNSTNSVQSEISPSTPSRQNFGVEGTPPDENQEKVPTAKLP